MHGIGKEEGEIVEGKEARLKGIWRKGNSKGKIKKRLEVQLRRKERERVAGSNGEHRRRNLTNGMINYRMHAQNDTEISVMK